MRARPLLLLVTFALVIALAWGVAWVGVGAQVGTGFAAKLTCSLVWNSGQDPQAVFRRYVAPKIAPLGPAVSLDVDREARVVEASALGLVRDRALYRPGLGCTLVEDADLEALRTETVPPASPPPLPEDAPWPEGGAGPAGPAPAAVEAALERAFAEPNPPGEPQRLTTAVLVVHRGRLVAERYAEGYDAATPMLSWSMAKSLLAALVGLAAERGYLALEAPATVPEWQDPDGPRGAITVDMLLRQSSGLAFDETYGAVNDVSRMLFMHGDTGAFAASFPLAHPPDTHWAYSSGTSNILARILRDAFGGDLARMVAFAREALYRPAGLGPVLFEPDASGSFIGSSFAFMSARDWARFGELHLRDGVWAGERVLPEGWVDYVTTPTPGSRGDYGAHWWLNAGPEDDPGARTWPTLPRAVYAARGHSGQYVVIDPTADLVVLRLGLAQIEGDAFHGIEPLIRDVRAALVGEGADAPEDAAQAPAE